MPRNKIRGKMNPKPGTHWIVVESGCWLWTRYKDRDGYGRVDGWKPMHRINYEKVIGPIPSGMQLDHICRNRGCVNPYHLEPVPNIVNIQRGSSAKLTPAKVKYARGAHANGCKVGRLAKLLGVTHGAISMAVAGVTWKNIESYA